MLKGLGTHCFYQWSCGSPVLRSVAVWKSDREGPGRKKLFTLLVTDRKQEECSQESAPS